MILGTEINNNNRTNVSTCKPRISMTSYVDVTFGRFRGNITYCGECLWLKPMDIHKDLTGQARQNPTYG
jgi:hypothetical protein